MNNLSIKLLSTLWVINGFCSTSWSQDQIIPRPASIEVTENNNQKPFVFNNETKFTVLSKNQNFNTAANNLINFLQSGMGLTGGQQTTKTAENPLQVIIRQTPALAKYGNEAYQLTLKYPQLIIEAPSEKGLFYAGQSLAQMLPGTFYSKDATKKQETVWALSSKNFHILDYPRFAWREVMLDEARHFYGPDEFKKLIDEMAKLKMNVLHWHLTDHEGWRIEIKRYPKLTSVGGTRRDTQVGTWKSTEFRGEPHSGFYTQKQIQELVKYAQDRNITVIPEIDIPGHSGAAVASYPELNLSVIKLDEVPTTFDGGAALDPTNEMTYQFIENIIDELIPLFPAKIIHIGGDEVRYNKEWKSEKIDQYMAKKGFKKYTDLQISFTNRISKMLASKGCRTMGWNEIMGSDVHNDAGQGAATGKLDPNAIIHYWYGPQKLVKEALEKGHQVVISSSKNTYLNRDNITMKDAYSFDPVFECVPNKQEKNILGLGCNLWTEWIPTARDAQRKLFPRMAAFAETGWTPKERKDYSSFKQRLPIYTQTLDAADIQHGDYVKD